MEKQQERALRLVEKLVRLGPDIGDANLALKALQMKERLTLVPMALILDKVPGNSVMEKSRLIGVTRQSYYYWLRGATRPNPRQAAKLAKLTGYGVDEIRGKFRLSPARS